MFSEKNNNQQTINTMEKSIKQNVNNNNSFKIGDFELYEIEETDFFEALADFDSLPKNIQDKLLPVYEVINAPDETWTPIIQEGDSSYKGCADLIEALETIGWTCDYGLDGLPIELQPL